MGDPKSLKLVKEEESIDYFTLYCSTLYYLNAVEEFRCNSVTTVSYNDAGTYVFTACCKCGRLGRH